MGKPFHLAGLGILLAFLAGCGGKSKPPPPPPSGGGGVPPVAGFSGFLEDPNPGTPLYTLYGQNPNAYADSMRNLEQILNDSGDFVPQTSLDVMYSTQELSGRRAILHRYNPNQNQLYQPRRLRIEGVISGRYGLSLDSENYVFVYELPGYSDAMKRPIESTDAVALFVSPAGGDDPRQVIKFFYRTNAGSHPLYSYLLEPGGGYSPPTSGQPISFDGAPSPWVSAHGPGLSLGEGRGSFPRPQPPPGWRTGSLHVIQTTGHATFYGGNRNFRQ